MEPPEVPEDPIVSTWKNASGQDNGGGESCVDVAVTASGGRAVRDSKNPDGPQLRFTRASFDMFLANLPELPR